MKKILKSKGLNKSEQIVSDLGEKTFLNLWSYPNVFRDEGLVKNGIGQEVCDLLVVCGKHVIIFSVKDIKFPNTGDINVDWKRWSNKAT